jgi:hypothetical protein
VSVPAPDAPWADIEEYALACAPRARHGELAHMASRTRQLWNRYGQLPDALADLQACLFFEQRRWHLFSAEPDGRARDYASALLLGIRRAASGAGMPKATSGLGDAAGLGDAKRAEAG